MRHTLVLTLPLLALTAGCVETESPTSTVLEQRVFTALGGLQPGESFSLSGADAAQVLLGGPTSAGQFVVVPFHASRVRGAELDLELTGRALGAPSPATATIPLDGALLDASVRPENWAMHEVLQDRFKRAVDPLIPRLGRSTGAGPSFSIAPQLTGDALRVGALVELNAEVFGEPCQEVDLRTGSIEAITEHAVIVADVGNPAGGFSRADYESFGREFDELVHPTITRVFGEPTDIDDNGRVVVFFTRAVNELTQPGDEGYVGGFFYARDLFPNSGAESCAASNAGEIFYILVPDPNAEASPIPHTRTNVFRGALGTIGHEYQHLINASRRIWIHDASSLEETWLNEALSHIGEELLFYDAAGMTPRSNVSLGDVQATEQRLNAINRFGIDNLVRYGLYLDEVTTDSPINTGDALATRGAAWAFLRYVADHLVESSDDEFFHALVNTDRIGLANLGAAMGSDPMDSLQRWGVSVYTDDLVENLSDSAYTQPSWHFRSLLGQLFTFFPLEVRTLGATASLNLELVAGTSGYVEFRGEGQTARLDVTSGNEPPPDALRVTIVRTE